MKYYFNIIINFFLGYFKYGCRKYPILFPISILLYLMDFYILFNTNRIDGWLITALISYALFFGILLIGYLNKYVESLNERKI